MPHPVRLAALAALVLAAPSVSRADEPVDVVATFSILGDMVARVGGDKVRVSTLVGPDGDAHVYQPTPQDAQAIAGADVVVVNGLGFEGFLERLVTAAGYQGPVVTAAAEVEPLPALAEEGEHEGEAEHDHAAEAGGEHDHAAEAGGEHHEEEHADEAGHHHHGAEDPHAWQDLGNGARYVRAIAEGLCTVDAADCAAFRANAEAYAGEILALDADVRGRVAAVPEARRVVITSHDAFRYFGAAYGVRFLAPQGVSTESEASAGDVAGLIGQIRETGVKTIFVENISDPRLIQQIAAETGAVAGPPIYSDALGAPGTPGDSYLKMMKHNAEALIAAIAEGS